MNSEEWRPVSGFPWYEVSSFGMIRRTVSTTCAKAGSLIAGRVGDRGYRYFNATANGKRKTLKFHRIVCEAFHGPQPSPRHVVAHNDGNRLNNRADNLRWATTRENHADRHEHGTNPAGSRNGRACLHEAQVQEIRRLHGLGGVTIGRLADLYEVYPTTVHKIIRRETWRHVP
jgi:hypothetical protein